ncbi:hypothetical protein Plim_4266 (plasmid) [Planctopirus limnophila DSM 3776]|uniref:Uncharacterized protein n=1 Tax=Planctopirus limnophila (strain ATCC 43296 / DSM 3776 / IFAM 1008 / Mu 290) TaxID=521674 RepID=D5SZF3_PLAL2|nr:hypothetical protein [Planctopirus limnophila]ADG70073.1 hypothetical protein Plim_4266 [Planctopirus limnophila DSM 3776]
MLAQLNFPNPLDPTGSYPNAFCWADEFCNFTQERRLSAVFKIYASPEAYFTGKPPVASRSITVEGQDYLDLLAANAAAFTSLGDLLSTHAKESVPEFSAAVQVPTTLPTTLDPRQLPE